MSDGPREALRIAQLLRTALTCLWTADDYGGAVAAGTSPALDMPAAFARPSVATGRVVVDRGALAQRALPLPLRARFAATGDALVVLRACGDARSGLIAVWTSPADAPAEVTAIASFAAEHWACVASNLHAAMRLAQVDAQLQALVFAVPQGVVLVPRGRAAGLVNPTAAALLGVPAGPATARDLATALHGLVSRAGNRDEVSPLIEDGLAGRASAVQGCVLRFDGVVSALDITVAPIAEGANGWVWVMEDVTLRELAVQRLAEAADVAEAATHAKSRFVSSISHEIRTPLNAVIGMTHLLRDTALDVTQEDYVATIDAASRHLLSLVNDVLDLSKIEAGAMAFARDTVSLPRLLQDVRAMFAPLAAAKGLTLQVTIDDGVVPVALTDEGRLRQMLVNLVNNAVKFTSQGHVAVGVSRVAAGPPVRVRFAVTDTGIGIDAEQQASLFRPFSQASTSITRTYGGTGLGLFLVRQFAEHLGGTVGLDSAPGRGSTFWFELPLDVPEPDAHGGRSRTGQAAGVVAPSLAGVRALVVDDNAVNRRVCQLLLRKLGVSVDTDVDGAAAVARLAHDAGFDVVLMDLQMRGMDGLTATRQIRERLGLATLPILAFTGSALAAERDAALAGGMNAVLIKPVEPLVLARTVAAHVTRRIDTVVASR